MKLINNHYYYNFFFNNKNINNFTPFGCAICILAKKVELNMKTILYNHFCVTDIITGVIRHDGIVKEHDRKLKKKMSAKELLHFTTPWCRSLSTIVI